MDSGGSQSRSLQGSHCLRCSEQQPSSGVRSDAPVRLSSCSDTIQFNLLTSPFCSKLLAAKSDMRLMDLFSGYFWITRHPDSRTRLSQDCGIPRSVVAFAGTVVVSSRRTPTAPPCPSGASQSPKAIRDARRVFPQADYDGELLGVAELAAYQMLLRAKP